MIIVVFLFLVILVGVYVSFKGLRRRTGRILKLVVVSVVVVLIAALIYAHTSDFMLIDDCIDDGGQWNYTSRVCEK